MVKISSYNNYWINEHGVIRVSLKGKFTTVKYFKWQGYDAVYLEKTVSSKKHYSYLHFKNELLNSAFPKRPPRDTSFILTDSLECPFTV